jgi:hypothetical protein
MNKVCDIKGCGQRSKYKYKVWWLCHHSYCEWDNKNDV